MAQSFGFADQVPRLPSEYCATNVGIGSSFLARHEAEAAVREGYADHIMWGSDYPHMEGTFQYPDSATEPSIGRMAMRFTFAGIAPENIRAMAGLNAVRIYGLDSTALSSVAAAIGAPTIHELSTPLEAIPSGGARFAFREFGPWA